MALRFPVTPNFRIAILAAVVAAAPVGALAQSDQNDPRVVPPPKSQKKLPEAPSKLPKVGGRSHPRTGLPVRRAEGRAR